MAHQEIKRIQQNASTAVLFVHGILGTPDHFRDLLPLLPEETSAWALLLDGHGKDAKAFAKSSMSVWEKQVKQAVEELAATHDRILIAAHSMGTLFAIDEALREPKITGLFLLAVPLYITLKPRAVRNSLKVCFHRVDHDPYALAAERACSVAIGKNPLACLGWLPRFCELLSKAKRTRPLIERLQTRCTVYHSQNDELVSARSLKHLLENDRISVCILPNSGHYAYAESDAACLQEQFRAFAATKTQATGKGKSSP
ncbi:MAG: alpha/beta fold hydrolase [Ruminococcaceae bacterium]|nr:alpha/beta fold hydrolase [Oscillospiraceae bacterium]